MGYYVVRDGQLIPRGEALREARRKQSQQKWISGHLLVSDSQEDAQNRVGVVCLLLPQVAWLLQITEAAVSQLVRRGTLEVHCRYGRMPLFALHEVERIARERGITR